MPASFSRAPDTVRTLASCVRKSTGLLPKRARSLMSSVMNSSPESIFTQSLTPCRVAAVGFPYPGPIIRPLLPPRLRWPETEIRAWVEAENFAPGFLEYFARDPERRIPAGDNLVSPADGVITAISQQDAITYFVVGLSFWDVHVVRTPLAGTVTAVESEGILLDRYPTQQRMKEMIFLHGKEAPVQQIVTLDTSYGQVKVRLITSYWASRLKVSVHPGQKLQKGERIGRILLGSTVALELPGDVTGFSVRERQRVAAGETIIALNARVSH